MTEEQELFLKVLSAALHDRRASCEEIREEFWMEMPKEGTLSWKQLERIARQQAVMPLINDYMLTWEAERMPQEKMQTFEKQTITTAVMYYRMVNFVFVILDLLKRESIGGCILKGVAMAGYYPKEELRKTGDIDLYIPVKEEFESFCRLLKGEGFEQEKTMTDHHRTYFCMFDGVRFELEVHIKPINKQDNALFHESIDRIFEPFTDRSRQRFSKAGIIHGTIPVLPAEENAFYLLLHMLQHFLSGGMGVRLLCDWVLFWEKEKISSQRFLSFVKQSRIEGFNYLVTGICTVYLGLSEECVPWMEGHMPKQETMEAFLEDMFLGGEFGECDTSRMLITVEKPSLRVYLKQLHRQMLLRFHRAGKVVLLWPFLWAAAGMMFVYNNKCLRNTSVGEVMKSTKERRKLLEELKLFEEWE